MEATGKQRQFEFFDATKTVLKVKNVTSGAASECEPECEKVLDAFAESDKDEAGVWYHGESMSLPDIVATLDRFTVKKGYHVSASVAETSDGKESILLRKLSESEFKATQKKL